MTVTELRIGAEVLMNVSRTLSGATGKSGLATGVVTESMRYTSALGLTVGADAVRSMGGPFFERFAADMFEQAKRINNGGPTGPAITSAMEGASLLLKRASHLP